MKRANLILIASLAGLPVASFAQPVPQSVSGGTDEGSQVVISGTGFGTIPNREFVFDNASSSVYPDVSHGTSVPVGSGYPFITNTFGSPGSAKFTQSHRRLPTLEAGFRTTDGTGYLMNPYALGGGSPSPAGHSVIYASVWYKPDQSIDIGGHSSKFIRVWDNNSGSGTRISWTQMHLTYGGADSPDWGGWGGNTGQWNRLEFYVNADTNVIKAWTNGVLRHDISDFVKDPGYSGTGLHVERIGFNPGGSSPPQFESSFSEIYISNSQARVELCDAATWAQCNQKELQFLETWNSDRITMQLALGQFAEDASSTPLFLYVVDHQGRVNASGIELCGDCPTPPDPPASVNVE